MSAPAHVLDAVRAAVDLALGHISPQGLGVGVHGPDVGQLRTRIVARADLYSSIAEAGELMPPEVFARLRAAPSNLVPVLWQVGGFRGAMSYAPKGSVS